MPNRRMAAFRLPPETIAQLNALAGELQGRSPGKVSQADAIVWAVARAINDLAVPEPTASPPPAVAPESLKRTHTPRAKSRVAAKGGKTDREAETSGQQMDAPAVLEQNRRRAVEGLLASSAKGGTAPKAVDVAAHSPTPIAAVAARLVEAINARDRISPKQSRPQTQRNPHQLLAPSSRRGRSRRHQSPRSLH